MTLKKNISASWAAHAVTLLVGFFLVPFVLHTIGEEGYGVWVFVNSIAGYSSLLYLGFGPTICRFVADHRARGEWDRVNQVVSSIFTVYAAGGATVFLIALGLAGAAPWLDKWGNVPIVEVQLAILILGLNITLGMLGSVYGGVLFATKRFDLQSAVQGTLALVRFGLTVLFLRERHGLVVLATIFLAITLLENLLTAWLAHRQLPTLSIRRRFVTRPVVRECFGFSAFNAVRLISMQTIYLTDTVVIGFVLGAQAIVPYYIASRLAQMIHTPLERVADVVLPTAGELHARGEHDRLRQLLMKGMGLSLLLAGGFWIGGVYFGDRLVFNWMGVEYQQTQLILAILVGAQILAQPMIVLRQVLLAMGHVRTPALMDLAQALGNLVLSLILIQLYGIVGVAWGTLIPMLAVELFLLLPYGMRLIDLRLIDIVSVVIVPQSIPLIALWIYSEGISRLTVPPGWLSLIAITLGGGLTLGVTRLAFDYLARRRDIENAPQLTSVTPEAPA